jgi:hypothetical protein
LKTTTTRFADFLAPTEELLEEARNGRMFILVDDEDRENEGDLVIPAQFATADAVNFMARFARGLICLAMARPRVEQLSLPLMAQHNGTRHSTAFTVSIEARDGVTTGISAADRARTIAVAINPDLGREQRARDLRRAAHGAQLGARVLELRLPMLERRLERRLLERRLGRRGGELLGHRAPRLLRLPPDELVISGNQWQSVALTCG